DRAIDAPLPAHVAPMQHEAFDRVRKLFCGFYSFCHNRNIAISRSKVKRGEELGKTLWITNGYGRRSVSGHSHSPAQRWSRPGWPRPRPQPHALRQGFVQHQHLAHRFRRDETDEASAAVDYGDGGSGFLLQHAECLIEAAAVADGR